MNLTLLIGIVAGVLTTVAFIPQVVKTWRSRSSGDLSLGMFGMMVTGVIFWLTYGFLTRDLPIILANIVTLSLQLTVVGLILTHRRRHRTVPMQGGDHTLN